ncbi:bifunctional gluaredoxin/ribonucleoside-diphosphate reductase subunit beta [Delftia phage PhiW-14]|uniref:ribonucleoside-diphosphate reductase n=1 Tax=Delftia phage PhiW-14 TaxID=665032 RepID=C9DFZ8_BPW14|nr:bifunctional gluaredoxin/ribonucleoside-diphosphate reductase subunit beta [Delftia phage PhiW-14]ACV50049.1 bifunctional gluaredoxin/ribonucleoside-diphosphate reductase subunit beta [Delftia phage PhiW-14]
MRVADSESKLFQVSSTYKPFLYQEFYDLMTKHEDAHWVKQEAELGDDVNDWRNRSSDDERSFIKEILTVFTQGDVVVADNYKSIFIPAFKNNEVSNWLVGVAAREVIHQDAYAMANETFGLPDSMFGRFREYQEMRERNDLMATQYDPSMVEGLAMGLVHTTFNEGVCLMGAFANLLQFNRFDVPGFNGYRGRYKGLTKINKWSLRDEGIHVEGSSLLYRKVMGEHPWLMTDEHKKQVYDLARAVVAAEDLFLDLAFKKYQLTMTKDESKAYVRYMMNRRLLQLGHKAIFEVQGIPCPWIEEILGGAGGKRDSNFFETRVDNYQASGALVGELDWSKVNQLVATRA